MLLVSLHENQFFLFDIRKNGHHAQTYKANKQNKTVKQNTGIMTGINITFMVIWQEMQAIAYLAFPNSPLSVVPKCSYSDEAEPIKHGIITSKS